MEHAGTVVELRFSPLIGRSLGRYLPASAVAPGEWTRPARLVYVDRFGQVSSQSAPATMRDPAR